MQHTVDASQKRLLERIPQHEFTEQHATLGWFWPTTQFCSIRLIDWGLQYQSINSLQNGNKVLKWKWIAKKATSRTGLLIDIIDAYIILKEEGLTAVSFWYYISLQTCRTERTEFYFDLRHFGLTKFQMANDDTYHQSKQANNVRFNILYNSQICNFLSIIVVMFHSGILVLLFETWYYNVHEGW